jgi:RNA polymerase sigma-70 factor (ECF subfamily)
LDNRALLGPPVAAVAQQAPATNLAEADDATLARALIAGQPEAPRLVWARFSALVRRIIRRSLGPEPDVEDVVQDVFASLFAKPAMLREPGSIRAFIVSVAMHSVSYELRRRRLRRLVGLAPTSELPDIRVVESHPESREALLRFYAILDRLRPRDRLAFVLRFIEGMKVADIASAMKISGPTARRCFTRAHQRVSLLVGRDPFLREYLADLHITLP